MAALFITKDAYASIESPSSEAEYPFYTVAQNDFSDPSGATPFSGWYEDRTRVTNDFGVAFLWAVALAGLADDGENPRPLARITAHRENPLDDEGVDDDDSDESDEHVVLYLTSGAEIIDRDEDEWAELHEDARTWPEIHKSVA